MLPAAAGGALAVLAGTCGVAADDGAQEVRTIAGSGGVGSVDAPALQATFSTPSDIARSSDGTIYVSDEAAQRIRALAPDGTVRTVAGSGQAGEQGFSVLGGYRDGAGAQAQFNHPLGMAVGPDGALYIADSKNACIRKLQHGIVTTIIGAPGSTVPVDGPAATAKLVSPRALAFDRSGRLWVADYGVGLRRLDPNGTLTTVPLRSNTDLRLLSLSISPDSDDPIVLALTPRFVFVYHLTTGTDSFFDVSQPAEGQARPFGFPIRIIALGRGQAIFTDGESNNVRYLRLPKALFYTTIYTRVIAGGALERGIDNAGSQDGSRNTAAFYSPRGLLQLGNNLIVVDSGNRKLREVILPHFRLPESGLSSDYHYDGKHFEIAYIGPSVTFWDSMGDDSICARIEERLDASSRLGRPARCHTIRIDAGTAQQVVDYISSYLTFQPIDVIVISIDPGACANEGFRPVLERLLSKLNKRTKLVMAWQFNYFTFSDDESLVERETSAGFQVYPAETYANVQAIESTVTHLFAGLPIFQYQSLDDFAAYERTPDHLPLYENPDTHFSPRGNAFWGDHVSDFLLSTVVGK